MTITPSLVELMFRCMSDLEPDRPTAGAFLFSQTKDNAESVIHRAVELVSRGKSESVLVLDSSPRCSYEGVEKWTAALIDGGIAENCIRLVPTAAYDTLHTLSEAQAFMAWEKEHRLGSFHIVAAPFHQPRAFMTVVSVLLREKSRALLYSRPGLAQDWTEMVVHSQGSLIARRAELIHTEIERIETYRRKGDVARDDEIIDYLASREHSKAA